MTPTSDTNHAVSLSTCANADQAQALARTLLERQLVACVNVVPGVRSYYRWKGAIEEDGEFLLIMKTRIDAISRLKETLLEAHPYDVPAFVVLDVKDGSADYLGWIDENVNGS